jgi:NADPH-dependent curcumin reductase CurA
MVINVLSAKGKMQEQKEMAQMSEDINRQVILATRPEGYPTEDNFGLIETPIPELRDGQVLLRTIWLSLDPYQRGRMNDAASYASPLRIGDAIVGGTVCKVVASRRQDLTEGQIVQGMTGWQTHAISDGRNLRKLDPQFAPVSTALGVLGMPGLTAYHGLFEIGQPKLGDTVVVSAASGAVGAIVGQLAKMMGCHVVGIAGSKQKIDYIVDELGFDSGINHKTEDVFNRLTVTCPRGVDVYFDNVGGPILDAVLEVVAESARIALCGQISQYNVQTAEGGVRNLRNLVGRRVRMEGFLVGQFANRSEEARQRLALWVNSGALKYKEDVVEGLENAPRAFIGLLNGANFGKLLVKVSDS